MRTARAPGVAAGRAPFLKALLASAAALLLALLPGAPAAAHHGWGRYDTRYAYYVAGTITDVQWSNPHVEVTLRVEETALPANWAQRELSPGLEELGGRATMASARPFSGAHRELHLVLAPIEYLAGVNIAVFHAGVYRTVAKWNLNTPAPFPARVAAAVSALAWTGVMIAGRLLAYI